MLDAGVLIPLHLRRKRYTKYFKRKNVSVDMKNLQALIGASLLGLSISQPATAFELHSYAVHDFLMPSLQQHYDQQTSCAQATSSDLFKEKEYTVQLGVGLNHQTSTSPIVYNAYIPTTNPERLQEAQTILKGERDEKYGMIKRWDFNYNHLISSFEDPDDSLTSVYRLEVASDGKKAAVASDLAMNIVQDDRQYFSDKQAYDSFPFHMTQEVYDALMEKKPESMPAMMGTFTLKGEWKCKDKDDFMWKWSQLNYDREHDWPGVWKDFKEKREEKYWEERRSLSFDQKVVAELTKYTPHNQPYLLYFEVKEVLPN